MAQYEKYQHHPGPEVWVNSTLRGTHKDHCLCFDCASFHPGQVGNCPIAQELYEFCVRNQVCTPVFECPVFVPLPPGTPKPMAP